MKTDIIVSGVGGQGILSIAAIIGEAAIHQNLYMKQAEVHGMSQRGGDVQSNLRISDKPIYSDLIAKGKANLILSLEPMEALRYLPYLALNGWIVTSSTPLINITNYQDAAELQKALDAVPNKVVFDVDKIAKEVGSARVSNMVMLGAATPFLGIAYEEIENGIKRIFERKGQDIVALNLKALAAGKKIADASIRI